MGGSKTFVGRKKTSGREGFFLGELTFDGGICSLFDRWIGVESFHDWKTLKNAKALSFLSYLTI